MQGRERQVFGRGVSAGLPLSQRPQRQGGGTGEDVVVGPPAARQGVRLEQLADSAEGEVLLERCAACGKNGQTAAPGEFRRGAQQRRLTNARRTIDDDEAPPRPLRIREAALE